MALIVAALCAAGPTLLPSAARAEDPETLIRQGVELRRKGQDARAEGYFRRAYQIAATSRTAAQLGLVELAVGNHADAEQHLSEALSSKDAWINQNRKSLEESRARAREKLVRVVFVSAPEGTSFAIEGGTDVRPLPADATIFLAPGPTTIRLTATGRKPTTVRVEGAAGETRKVTVDMPAPPVEPLKTAPPPAVPAASEPPVASPEATPTPPPATETSAPPAPEAAPGRGLRVAGIAVGAAGVGAAIVGGILYAQGNSKKKSIEDAAAGGGDYDPSKGNWESLRNAGVGFMIGGGVAIAGGVGLFIAGKKAGSSEAPATVSFAPMPGLGVLSYRGSF
jgi:hypothetical protein